MSGQCSCRTTPTYRQLDRSCPQHGDAADARRLNRRTGNSGERYGERTTTVSAVTP